MATPETEVKLVVRIPCNEAFKAQLERAVEDLPNRFVRKIRERDRMHAELAEAIASGLAVYLARSFTD